MSLNRLYYSMLKRDFEEEKGPEINKVGYTMDVSIGLLERKVGFTATIQPQPGSPDPIEDDLLVKIKEILNDNYKGFPVKVRYVGNVMKRDKE